MQAQWFMLAPLDGDEKPWDPVSKANPKLTRWQSEHSTDGQESRLFTLIWAEQCMGVESLHRQGASMTLVQRCLYRHTFLQQAAAQTPPCAFTGCCTLCGYVLEDNSKCSIIFWRIWNMGTSTAKPGEVCIRRFDILKRCYELVWCSVHTNYLPRWEVDWDSSFSCTGTG